MAVATRGLQLAGILALGSGVGHWLIGENELTPAIRVGPHKPAHDDVLTGWREGGFMFVVFGLNYFRLSNLARIGLTSIDKAIFGVQALTHLFAILSFRSQAPKLANFAVVAPALIGFGLKLSG